MLRTHPKGRLVLRGREREERRPALGSTGNSRLAQIGGVQSVSAQNDERSERMDSVFENIFLAIIESQEIQAEEEDNMEPVLAGRDVIDNKIESDSQLGGKLEEQGDQEWKAGK